MPNVSATAFEDQMKYAWSPLPTRQNMIDSLKKDEFDVLVIGGGATGCGVALDAVSRGDVQIHLLEHIYCFEPVGQSLNQAMST